VVASIIARSDVSSAWAVDSCRYPTIALTTTTPKITTQSTYGPRRPVTTPETTST